MWSNFLFTILTKCRSVGVLSLNLLLTVKKIPFFLCILPCFCFLIFQLPLLVFYLLYAVLSLFRCSCFFRAAAFFYHGSHGFEITLGMCFSLYSYFLVVLCLSRIMLSSFFSLYGVWCWQFTYMVVAVLGTIGPRIWDILFGFVLSTCSWPLLQSK